MNSMFRRLSVAFSRVLIGAMLFAQLVNAGEACVMPAMSPVMAFANADHASDCAKRVNPNSCLQQTTATDQSVGHAEVPVLGMSNVIVLTVPRTPFATTSYVVATAIPHRSTDPPSSIRFCSFQL
jgi:hypothetical protein